MVKAAWAGSLALAVVIGCGDDDAGGGGGEAGDPVSTSEASATCADFAAHAEGCGWGGNINETDWNCGEAAVVWRGDVFRGVANCAIDLPCTGMGSTCLASTEVEPLPVHQAYASRCEARKTECDLVGSGDASSIILLCDADLLAAYATPILDMIIGCFDEACVDVVPCLESQL